MAEKPLILAVERNPTNVELLGRYLEDEGYRVIGAASYEEFDEVLKQPEKIDLALIDITGFDRHIWDRSERLRDKEIPFLLISPKQSAALQQESVMRGARGVLIKPLVIRDLLRLIKSLFEE